MTATSSPPVMPISISNHSFTAAIRWALIGFLRCLGRNFKTSMCTFSYYASPSLLWITHSLIYCYDLHFTLSHFSSLIYLSHFLSLFTPFPPPHSLPSPPKHQNVQCLLCLLQEQNMFPGHFQSLWFGKGKKTKRQYTLKYLTQVAMFSSSNSSLRSSMWEENRGSPFALVKEKPRCMKLKFE